ncbi:Protein kinase [Mycena indigotica]|uniref:non-specific serine/threonine protein kinase n=1 Tax=Mycena indigotica TaxID=2126181 RepID=A0A8H6SLR4_9AGAR|nr:Protein kinase [Mycena indigotica]KAF7301343.1 Protein kinase [Mycena indigotica]
MTSDRPALSGVVGAESLSSYGPNGNHPVHIGDQFSHGRYTVVHKLGYGRTSTTWLVLDEQTQSYASLKIVMAGRTVTEVEVLRHLQATYDATEEGSEHVGRMFDSFIHEGPNGKHQCIVGEVFGANLASDVYWGSFWENESLPIEMVRRLSGQLALGLRYLHRRGVAHGDLHPGNMLLCLPNALTSPEDVKRYMGMPHKCFVRNETGYSPPHIPEYLVPGLTINTTNLHLCFTKSNVKICDFSESYMASLSTIPQLATPLALRPPDAVLDTMPHATTELDIWALGVTFHMLLVGGLEPFICPGGFLGGKRDWNRMLKEMVLRMGKFPEPLWSQWNRRNDDFDDDGQPLDSNTKIPSRLVSKYCDLHGEELVVYEALLRSIFQYQPHERITAEQLVSSTWICDYCRPEMEEGRVFDVPDFS